MGENLFPPQKLQVDTFADVDPGLTFYGLIPSAELPKSPKNGERVYALIRRGFLKTLVEFRITASSSGVVNPSRPFRTCSAHYSRMGPRPTALQTHEAPSSEHLSRVISPEGWRYFLSNVPRADTWALFAYFASA